MTIINTSPDRIIQLGYEGEDRVTVLRFRYGKDWLENGEGIFNIRVRRHGEHTAYNAALVADDAENNCLLMTVTNTELSVKGSGEMQVVYSGENFVKKSPIYSYNVSRAVDEAVNPPAQDVYTQIIESLSGLHDTVWDIDRAVAETDAHVGNLAELTTTSKTDLVSAINEVNEHDGGSTVTVDDALSTTSTNPVQNKIITGALAGKADKSFVDVLADDVADVKTDTGALKTAIQGKADIQTVSALADAVNDLDSDVQGLQTAVQGKADTSTVTALSVTVSNISDAAQQYMEYTNSAITNLRDSKASKSDVDSKASKSYVDTQLATKASTATATTSADGLMSAQDKVKLDTVGSVVTVSGATPAITAVSGVRYVCGEVATLDFTPCATGVCDVVFTSGNTPTAVTLPNTVKFPDGSFTAEANKTYEINILDGVYGVVMAWT